MSSALKKRIAQAESIAVFPLPNVTLFPGQALPLHIFEERYRRMLNDTLQGNRLLVMAKLRPGYEAEYEGRPAVYEVAGIGEIVTHNQLPDGRSLIVVAGVGRVHIDEELPPKVPYRRAKVTVLDDRGGHHPDDIMFPSDSLVSTCRRFVQATGGHVDGLNDQLRECADDFRRIDFLCASFAPGPAIRQELLECLDPLERLTRLRQVLERILDESASRLN